jgi:hypothetical protein
LWGRGRGRGRCRRKRDVDVRLLGYRGRNLGREG